MEGSYNGGKSHDDEDHQSNGKASHYQVPGMTDDNNNNDHDEKDAERNSLRYEAALSVLNEDEIVEDPLQQDGTTFASAPDRPTAPRPRPGLTPQRVLLTPAARVTKGEAASQPVDTGRHNPGAYQIQGRAFGAIPMWARVRQASRALRSTRSVRLFTSDAEQGDSEPEVTLGRRPAPEVDAPDESFVADSSPQSVPNDDNDDMDDEQRKTKKRRLYCWGGILCLLVLWAIAIGVGLGVALKGSLSNSPPPLKDPKCDFTSQTQPNVFQQCDCSGSVDIITTDVANRYNQLLAGATFGNTSEPINSCTPNNLATLWVATDLAEGLIDANPIRLLNRYALAVLFIKWGGKMWVHNDGWLSPDNECGWFGVSCQKQNVTGLSLSNIIIPLSNNILPPQNYRIPSELFLLTELDSLYLANNSLTGNVSSALSELSNLVNLCLGGNSLTGSFPFSEAASLTKLQALDLSNNVWTGSLPASIGNLTSLELLLVTSAPFSGTIPSEIARLTNLVIIDFTNALFTGSLPSQLGKLTKLEFLHISGYLKGPLPTELMRLTNLRYLSITGGTLMVGTLPTQLGALSKLLYLQLDNNSFNGPIPSSLGLCTSLIQLELQQNSLSGTIPSELGLIPTLNLLDMSTNLLRGSIPQELFLNSNLEILILEGNKFNALPANVGNATALACLDVAVNSLKGTVPLSLCKLPGIKTVAVDCPVPKGCSCCVCPGTGVCSLGDFAINPIVHPNISVGFPCG